MDREQIIKALECCVEVKCDSVAICPRRENCTNRFVCSANLKKDALSLINSQEQRIKELTEENERLRADNDELCDNIACLEIDKENAERRTARKMQERLTSFFANDDNLKYNEVDAEYVNEQIDQIAKEMLEGNDENND